MCRLCVNLTYRQTKAVLVIYPYFTATQVLYSTKLRVVKYIAMSRPAQLFYCLIWLLLSYAGTGKRYPWHIGRKSKREKSRAQICKHLRSPEPIPTASLCSLAGRYDNPILCTWSNRINFASLCSLAGRYDNLILILIRFLAPIDCLKIPAHPPHSPRPPQSMGNRVGRGVSYRSASLHRLVELIPWHRFLGSWKVKKFELCSRWLIGYIGHSLESISGLLKHLQIRA